MNPPDLQFVADRIAIVDLLTQYWMHVDRRVWEPVKAIFVPGTLVDYSDLMPIGDAVPAEEVVDRIAAAIDIYAVTVHNMGNCEVSSTATPRPRSPSSSPTTCTRIPNDSRVACRSRGCATATGSSARDAGWRVEHRRATTDWRAWWEPRTPTYVDGKHQ